MSGRKDHPPAAAATQARPLLEVCAALSRHVKFAPLATLPTPCEPLALPAGVNGAECFVKRDDLSAAEYGGNKVRTLEVLFGRALQVGARRVVSTGAFGSNHAVATVVHAPRLGLQTGALLCPQPHSAVALENLRVTAALARRFFAMPHWSCVPFCIGGWRLVESSALVMPPGGATPLGALGYVSAAFELALQIAAHELPLPERIVLPVGSTCTSAGLLVGLRLARALGVGFPHSVPQVHAVRVTPWPVTSALRITHLAARTARFIAERLGRPELAFERKLLAAGLHVDGRFLGQGYGIPTARGMEARQQLGAFGETLDTTYSAKAAAALLTLAPRARGPMLFWATKSSAPLPAVNLERDADLPAWVRAWIRKAQQSDPRA